MGSSLGPRALVPPAWRGDEHGPEEPCRLREIREPTTTTVAGVPWSAFVMRHRLALIGLRIIPVPHRAGDDHRHFGVGLVLSFWLLLMGGPLMVALTAWHVRASVDVLT